MYDCSEAAPIFDAISSPVSETSIARFGSTRAVENAEIRVGAAGDVEQPEILRRGETALDALASGVELTRPRQRDADRVGGLCDCRGRRSADLSGDRTPAP